jgi:peptidoglycan/LPS O-acetylase OafA/YrhL
MKNQRIQSIDFYRGIAVLSVMFFHFNELLPFGYLGVDLFFIISGFLVGGILVELYMSSNIKYFKFILQRGFKIWPSYFFFLIIGNLIAYFSFHDIKPEYYIQLKDMSRYILFYRNFMGEPNHWTFDHIWSLCVEEHFYIIFPIALMFLLWIKKPNMKYLLFTVLLMILSGFIFKYLAFNYTNGKDTYSATYNRIDELAYGILIYLYFKSKKEWFSHIFYLIASVLFLGILLYIEYNHLSVFYSKVCFHSLIPIPFSMIIINTFNVTFDRFKLLKYTAKYSYNLYLWHPLVFGFIIVYYKVNIIGFLIYFLITFCLAFLTTKYIEIPFLNIRNNLIK